jgi:DNA/RNA-binding domain of Phe-tRNA-synthetase-like protein
MFTISENWKQTYPGASVGVLAMRQVTNPDTHPELDARKDEIEAELRTRFEGYDRPALRAEPVLQAYHEYYKRFKKTFHVQGQLESILWKGKSIPRVAALVEAMFMAELQDQLLTSGHDLDLVQQSAGIDAATGEEQFIGIRGNEIRLKANDMFIADAKGVISSVIYGPDKRTSINENTTAVLFTVYAPSGIEETAVRAHLDHIETYVRLISPEAVTELKEVYGTE